MPHQISEEATRKQMIDPQLEQAGSYLRDHSKVKIEIPVDGYDAELWNGVSDYTLDRENGEVLAVVVEAKKTATDVRLAETSSRNRDASTGSAPRVYEPLLDMFGANEVERWFTEKR